MYDENIPAMEQTRGGGYAFRDPDHPFCSNAATDLKSSTLSTARNAAIRLPEYSELQQPPLA